MRTRVSNPSGAFGGGKCSSEPNIILASFLSSAGAPAFRDSGGPGDREVRRLLAGLSGGQDRDGYPRVAADVASLLVFGQVCGDELIAVGRGFEGHPNDGYLGAAVGVEGDQRGVGGGSDELAGGVVEFHEVVLPLRPRFHSRYGGFILVMAASRRAVLRRRPAGVLAGRALANCRRGEYGAS
jgi:hypothetical protein